MFVLVIFCHSQIINAQSQSCPDCPIDFGWGATGQGLVISQIELSGSIDNDLGVTPLTDVCVNIQHEWLSDIFVVLASPGGEVYYLMGDDGNFTGECGNPSPKNMNVCFTVGNINPISENEPYYFSCNGDPNFNCFEGDWNVSCGNSLFSDLVPFALPAPNCDLDDFNVAGQPVNGVWTLMVGCVCMNQEWEAVLMDWSINFEGGASLISNIPTCNTNSYDMSTEEYSLCNEATYGHFYAKITNNIYNQIPLPPYYYQDYSVLMTENEEIMGLSPSYFNAQNYEVGNYLTSRISYNTDFAGSMLDVIGMTKDEATIYLQDLGVCFEWAEGFHPVEITSEPEPSFMEAVICEGESFVIGDSVLTENGLYQVIIDSDSYYHCDSTIAVLLEITETEVFAEMKASPCLGENLELIIENGESVVWTGPNNFSSTELTPEIENFSENMTGFYIAEITALNGCTKEVFVEVWSNCEFSETVLEMELGTEICFDNISDTPDYCYSNNNSISFTQANNCLEITAFSAGKDTICLTDLVGEKTAHRIIIEVPTPIYAYPGDLNFDGFCNHLDLLYLGLAYDSEGYPRSSADLIWQPQYAPNWEGLTPQTSVNFKHADANGNGQIEATDLEGIVNNYNENQPDGTNIGLFYDASAFSNPATFSLELPQLIPGETHEIPLFLGNEDSPAENFYGVAFTIDLDPLLVENISFQFENNFFGNETEDWLSFSNYDEGKLRASISRLDGNSVSGFGQIGILILEVAADYADGGTAIFTLNPDLCLNENEEFCGILRTQQTTVTTATKPEVLPNNWTLAPNPANNFLILETPNSIIDNLYLINFQNRIAKSWLPNSNNVKMEIDELAAGVYILVVESGGDRFFEKVVVLK